ncbi:abc transporter [Nannochloropsis oceanica]
MGPECSVCTASSSCQAVQEQQDGEDNENLMASTRMICDRSLEVIDRTHGMCRVATQAVSDFLQGRAYVTSQVTAAGDLHFEFVKITGEEERYETMFKCDGIGCIQVKDVKTNKIQTTCPSARCNTTCEVGGPDESCTTFVASQVEQIGARGPMTLTCNTDGTTSGTGTECIVHERLLDFYFQGVELDDCHFGECVPAGARAQVAEGSLADFALRNAEIFLESTYILAAIFGVLVCVVICLGLGLYYAMSEYYTLGSCQAMVADLAPVYLKPVPTTLTFSHVGYKLKDRTILKGLSGVAPAGEILAIMGPSGCGKSTLMDILSMKAKSGKVSGQIYVNGAPLTETFKKCIGFVGQHDMLMPTLTVMESLMFSGLLRLPKRLTMKEKTQRVLAVLTELQLAHIADSKVGNEVTRGISGGEKRRVSVGMELVTSPRLLCLDEPTSGLDSYNADLLVQILMDLAQARKTAVVMVIHQPRANIFARLDRLLLVCKGETVFSGAGKDVHPYFASIGRPIPPAFNAADYLIDILFTHNVEEEEEAGLQLAVVDEEKIHGKVVNTPVAANIENGGWPSGAVAGAGGDLGEGGVAFTCLADLFAASCYAAQTQQEVESQIKTPRSTFRQDSDGEGGTANLTSRSRPFLLSKQSLSLRPVPRTEEEAKDEKEARVGWLMEVSVVSQRMFKDMLRKPSLVVTHLLACVYFGCLLGLLYFQITTDGIAAIQNRMGIFMLEALFLAFTSVSALPLFWIERPLYMHERSNRYYGTLSYFVSKIFSDLIPLRVLPPILLSITTHLLVGLRGGIHFFTYSLVLVLMTAIAATINLIIGMLTKGIMSGILIATICMIHLILLTTIFVNFDTMKVAFFRGLRYVSFFNYGYEALVINELAGRRITNFNISDGTVVLRSLGFHPESMSFNTFILFAYLMAALSAAYLVLCFCVKERR